MSISRKAKLIAALTILCTICAIGFYASTYEQVSGDVLVYYAYLDDVNQLSIFNGTSSQCEPLPHSLIISPGFYRFNDGIYDMRQEGFYRLLHIGGENQQRIVYENNSLALMSGICWIAYHGNADDKKSMTELNAESTQRKLSLTCGPVSMWAVNLLAESGIQSRVVTTLTVDELNHYNNGHTFIEVYSGDQRTMETNEQWTLYDLTTNSYFTCANKTLNLLEFAEVINNNATYEIHRISRDTMIDISGFESKSGYDYGLWSEMLFSDEKYIREWYKRVVHVPLIRDNNDYWFYDSNNRDWVESYAPNYRYIDETEFMEKFYS